MKKLTLVHVTQIRPFQRWVEKEAKDLRKVIYGYIYI